MMRLMFAPHLFTPPSGAHQCISAHIFSRGQFSSSPIRAGRCRCTLLDHAHDQHDCLQVHDTPTALLIEREFAELDIKRVAEKVGGIRTRQHTNPLKASLMAPVPPPKWEDMYPDPSLPIMVDIGCGSGRFLMMMAKRNTETSNFLGLEIRHQLVSRAKLWAGELNLHNLGFMVANATVSFGSILSSYPGSLTCVTILCPDPHFKSRHHKRRIVQRPLVDAVVDGLAPGGKVFLQSDVKEVAVDMKNHFDREGISLVSELQMNPEAHDDDGWLLENPLGIQTEREIHTLSTGGKMYRILYRRL